MRKHPAKKAEKYRIVSGPMRSLRADGNNGTFKIPSPVRKQDILYVIASDGEQWLPVVGWESLYEVSTNGRIRALPKVINIPLTNGKRIHKLCILSQHETERGYMRVTLCRDATRQNFMAHRLVAEAFIDNPQKFPQINHKDGIKDSNHVTNLEWCSQAYNQHHAVENNLSAGFKIAEIEQIQLMLESGKTSAQIAEMIGSNRQSISDLKFGRHRNLNPEKPSGYEGMPLWDHCSVSLKMRPPSWKELCFIKDLFWEPEETVIQYHPPASKYINQHYFVLHLWRPQEIDIPMPPINFV